MGKKDITFPTACKRRWLKCILLMFVTYSLLGYALLSQNRWKELDLLLSALNVNRGWFVLQPWRSRVTQSQSWKWLSEDRRNALRDAVVWDYWAGESAYHIAISLFFTSYSCQKRAASTGCAEATNSYLFQLNVRRPKCHMRKVGFSVFSLATLFHSRLL